MERDLIALDDITPEELNALLDFGLRIKREPETYANALSGKTMLMIFAKPSLRTRVSFETGMTQMGGHAIYYNIATSPMGDKETVADTARCASRYADIIMARLFEHSQMVELADNSDVPVINGLTDYAHPCQVLADLLTMREKLGDLQGKTLVFMGDGNNNMAHSLLLGCAMAGMNVRVGCPSGSEYEPQPAAVEKAKAAANVSGGSVLITDDPAEAMSGADVVYTDSWMSYHIPAEKKQERVDMFASFRVDEKAMALADKQAIFMHCLPAQRGYEMTAKVIDGPQSVVFDEAENRLHAQKALVLWLLGVE